MPVLWERNEGVNMTKVYLFQHEKTQEIIKVKAKNFSEAMIVASARPGRNHLIFVGMGKEG